MGRIRSSDETPAAPCALALCAFALCAFALPAAGQTRAEPVMLENWGFFQRNEDGSNQWKYEPRLYVPFQFADGGSFTQRVDVPLIYTNASGAGNPSGGYSGGVGDIFIEEIFESREVQPNLRWRASVRFVFPTGKQSPFGSSQYQWAPGGGFTYAMPDALHGVTLEPYVRYFSGFDPQYEDVKEVRKLDLYPAATFGLGDRWSLLLYPDNPITYNEQKRTWFVPLDLMLARRLDRTFELGLGGAWKLGNPSDPSFRYMIYGRVNISF